MPRTKSVLASDMSLADIKHLLAAKEKMIVLEEKKTKLEEGLAAVNAQLEKLTASIRPGAPRAGRKPGRKPGRPAAKKAGRRVAKKTKTKTKAKAPVGRKVKRAPARKGGTLQEVVATLIRENGKPMAFQDILAAIAKRKLVRTRSKNFANVLRRTISGSKAFNNVARGVYGLKG